MRLLSTTTEAEIYGFRLLIIGYADVVTNVVLALLTLARKGYLTVLFHVKPTFN